MASLKNTLKTYYKLAKPGIVYGNDLTAIGGFLFAADFQIIPFAGMLIGISLIMGCGCVLNNILDREMDSKMDRTKTRALVTGLVTPTNALVYAIILGLTGAASLFFFTNLLTAVIGLVGLFFYVVVYGYFKRKNIYGTIVGSISGAIPPVVGYCAVTNRLDLSALILFLILVLWQMPHFYSIAIYRKDDYASAGVPVLSVKNGIHTSKIHIVLYIIGFIMALSLLALFSSAGYSYLVAMGIVSLIWLRKGLQGFQAGNDDILWARKMFKFSLIVLLVFSAAISLNSFLP